MILKCGSLVRLGNSRAALRRKFQHERTNMQTKRLTTKPAQEVITAIQALDLTSVKTRLMDAELGEGWTQEYADSIEEAYKTYLTMLVKYQEHAEDIMLAKDVDEFWHTHILQTMKYMDDCERVFGGYLHHNPHVGKVTEADLAKRTELAAKTRQLYAAEYAHPDAAWSGRFAEAGAAFSSAAVGAKNAAFSSAALNATGAAFSSAAVIAPNAAFSSAAVRAQNAAFSSAAVHPQNAAFSSAAVRAENSAFSSVAISAKNGAFSSAAVHAENAAFSSAAVRAENAAFSSAAVRPEHAAFSSAAVTAPDAASSGCRSADRAGI